MWRWSLIVYLAYAAIIVGSDLSHRVVNAVKSCREYNKCCSLGLEEGREGNSKYVAMVVLPVALILLVLDGLPWTHQHWFSVPVSDEVWDTYVAPFGVPLALFSDFMFVASHIGLGWSWTPTIGKKHDHVLKTQFPYNFARHPMYSSLLPLPAVAFLLLGNWVVTLALAILLIWPVHRFRAEERIMLELFGDEYEEYASGTGPFIWFLSRGLHDKQVVATQKQPLLEATV